MSGFRSIALRSSDAGMANSMTGSHAVADRGVPAGRHQCGPSEDLAGGAEGYGCRPALGVPSQSLVQGNLSACNHEQAVRVLPLTDQLRTLRFDNFGAEDGDARQLLVGQIPE